MIFSEDFQFSQASLQDYVDCPRRFELRYVRGVAWPAIEAEPFLEHEQHLQQGQAFHRMVQQHLLGIPEERLTRLVGNDDKLGQWWQNYLDAQPAALEGERYPEVTLSSALAGYRLVAKYDVVVATPDGKGIIFDWKTGKYQPRRKTLFDRLQTRVYRWLLVSAGQHLNGDRPFRPGDIEMRYWFANFPDQPELFPYDVTAYEADGDYLMALIAEILDCSREEMFPLTDDVKKQCTYCPYRSLCERGETAGVFEEAAPEVEAEALDAFDLDFDQIAEIEF